MAEYLEHLHCSRCGKRVSGIDHELGLVVRAWVECPECLEDEVVDRCINCGHPFADVDKEIRYYFGAPAAQVGPLCEACDQIVKTHTNFHPVDA